MSQIFNDYYGCEMMTLRSDVELQKILFSLKGIEVKNLFMDQAGRYVIFYKRHASEPLTGKETVVAEPTKTENAKTEPKEEKNGVFSPKKGIK